MKSFWRDQLDILEPFLYLQATILTTNDDETALSEIDLDLRAAAKLDKNKLEESISDDSQIDIDNATELPTSAGTTTSARSVSGTIKKNVKGRKRTASKEGKKMVPKKQLVLCGVPVDDFLMT